MDEESDTVSTKEIEERKAKLLGGNEEAMKAGFKENSHREFIKMRMFS